MTSVILGTDGIVDYVQLSDGTKYMLASFSVLQFVKELVSFRAEEVLDTFLEDGEVLCSVDEDSMFEFLNSKRDKRRRLSSFTSPSILSEGQKGTPMITASILDHMEQQVAEIEKLSAEHASIEVPVEKFRKLLACCQQNNTPSLPAFSENSEMVDQIHQQIEATATKITALEAVGKKFNAAKARLDLYQITADLNTVLTDLDLAEPWVQEHIATLADKTASVHQLFFSKGA